ncbi:TetR/AcrR family transcriptional regulator [Nocardia cyriacigeorgica]|uniref:TetR/AcrR family transcriptional regulator n=1 Tax=Nocardia cyriacigeorgica TaxID=135487 RepID=UPI0024546491|nr:helix-turn-helix domain-containing protein [Nocardia cyriacigeorgica]
MLNPRAREGDLTAKARIRNAAMDLFAQHGESRVSLRAVAAEAEVTLGLVQHHFKTKAGLREAVDQLVVDYFAAAVASVPPEGSPAEVAAGRDDAVRKMLQDNPAVVNYVRRVVLEPDAPGTQLLRSLIDLTRQEIGILRKSGLASTQRTESEQVVAVMLRQLGDLLLAPLVDAVWDEVAEPGDAVRPRLAITLEK